MLRASCSHRRRRIPGAALHFRQDVKKLLRHPQRRALAGKTLADAIDFNNAHAADEMPFFAQEIFDLAQSLAPGPMIHSLISAA